MSAQRAACPSTSCTRPRPTYLAPCPRAFGVRRLRCAKLPVALPASRMTCPRPLAVCPDFVPHLDEKLCGCLRVCLHVLAGPRRYWLALLGHTAGGIRQAAVHRLVARAIRVCRLVHPATVTPCPAPLTSCAVGMRLLG